MPCPRKLFAWAVIVTAWLVTAIFFLKFLFIGMLSGRSIAVPWGCSNFIHLMKCVHGRTPVLSGDACMQQVYQVQNSGDSTVVVEYHK